MESFTHTMLVITRLCLTNKSVPGYQRPQT